MHLGLQVAKTHIKHCFIYPKPRSLLFFSILLSMALRALLLLGFLLISLAQVSSDLNLQEDQSPAFDGSVRGGNRRLMKDIECGELCKVRCSLHSRPKVCLRACGTCCFRCKCVPPGTSGNKEVCGKCYTGMTTHGNQTKCP